MLKKKSLGQHFLKSPQIIADIVKAGNIKGGDVVLEVGPGEGVLTSELILSGAQTISVEKDDRLIPELQRKFAVEIFKKQLNLIHADILNIDPVDLIKTPYKVIANIPYYITGQIIRMFLESRHQPESMTLLIQKEVAERIVARDKKESLLSLSVKIYGEPKIIRLVGRGAFSPQPNVDSAVLNIEKISKDKLLGINEQVFFGVIHAGFAHKRKQLLPNLALVYKKEKVVKIFEKLGLDPKTRAEDLNIETWMQICKEF